MGAYSQSKKPTAKCKRCPQTSNLVTLQDGTLTLCRPCSNMYTTLLEKSLGMGWVEQCQMWTDFYKGD